MNKRAEEHGAEEPKEERDIGRERKERRKMRDQTTCGRSEGTKGKTMAMCKCAPEEGRKREKERGRGGPYCCDGVFHTYAGFIIRAHCFAVECIRAYDDFWGDKRRGEGREGGADEVYRATAKKLTTRRYPVRGVGVGKFRVPLGL